MTGMPLVFGILFTGLKGPFFQPRPKAWVRVKVLFGPERPVPSIGVKENGPFRTGLSDPRPPLRSGLGW